MVADLFRFLPDTAQRALVLVAAGLVILVDVAALACLVQLFAPRRLLVLDGPLGFLNRFVAKRRLMRLGNRRGMFLEIAVWPSPKYAGRIVRQVLRASDVVCREGRTLFAFLPGQMDLSSYDTVIRRIEAPLQAAGIGIACITPWVETAADAAEYLAGGNVAEARL